MKVQASTALEIQKARELALSGFRYFGDALLTRCPLPGPNPRR